MPHMSQERFLELLAAVNSQDGQDYPVRVFQDVQEFCGTHMFDLGEADQGHVVALLRPLRKNLEAKNAYMALEICKELLRENGGDIGELVEVDRPLKPRSPVSTRS